MKVDLILFLGQSNMQGQTELLTENAVVKGAYEYKFLTDELVPLKNPVGENISADYEKGTDPDLKKLAFWLNTHVAGASVDGNTNMVPEFCRAYIKETDRNVVAAHIAKGSTEIVYWTPNSDGYCAIVKKGLAAIKKIGKENIGRIFCIWLQGESDAIAATKKDDYIKRITALKDGLKKDLGIEKFCIIKVGSFTNDKRDEEIFAAQEEVCAKDADFVMLTRITAKLLQDKKYLNPFVAGHYGSYGQEVLGRTAGRNLAMFVKGLPFDA